MRLIGVMPVKNEDWILGFSLRAALRWCDEMVVLNHGSTDGSLEIIREVMDEEELGRISLLTEDCGPWDEMRHRGRMLEAARDQMATHIAIIDSDEVLTANLLPTIRNIVATTPKGSMLNLPGYNLRGSTACYHANGIWGNRIFSTAFRDQNEASWNGDRYHQREPLGVAWTPYEPIQQGAGGTMHFWGASEERLHEKHRAYRIIERLRWPSKPACEIERTYSLAEKGIPGSGDVPAHWTYSLVPGSWYAGYEDILKHLDVNKTPWQKEWCDRMIEEHGRELFRGLSV